MTVNDTIKTLMSGKNITQGEITKRLGMKSQSGVSQALNRDMKVSMLIRFLNTLDCDLVIRDKESGKEYMVVE
jgi:hypothetical protein